MSGDVLERNVRALLRESYVPALPTPTFRDRLESLVLAEVERRALADHAPRWPVLRDRRSRLRLAVAAAGLAAALLMAALGLKIWFGGSSASPGSRAALLARGEVALSLVDGLWRAATDAEAAEGLAYAGPALLVETPVDRPFPVRAAGDVVRLAGRSALTVHGPAAAPRVTLLRGRGTWLNGEDGTIVRDLAVGVPAVLGRAREPARTAPVDERHEADEARVPAPVGTPAANAGTPAPTLLVTGLSGRVVEASSGDPVTRFTVGLLGKAVDFSPAVPVTRTFESTDGTFTWPDAPTGEQRVFVFAEHFVLAQLGRRELPLPEPVVAELDPGEALRGSVLDPQGNPVPDALVIPESELPCDMITLRDAEQAFWVPVAARTRPDGRFVLPHLPAGPQTLRVTADDWAPAWVTLEVTGAASAPEVVVRLQPGGAIAGRVTGADGGPRAGALLITMPMDASQGQRRAHFDMTNTDADGRFRFEHLPAGSMIVVLTGQDAPPEVKPVRVREGEVEPVDFAAPHGGVRLRGLLMDPQGAPIGLQNMALIDFEASDTTRWDQSWVATTTDAQGRYVFDGVAPGNYQIFLIADQGRGLRMVDELPVRDEPEVLHDVRVPPARLEVSVLDPRGSPEAGAILFLFRRTGDRWAFAGHGRTDDRGRGDFTGVPVGVYRIEACPTREGPGHAWREGVALTATDPAATVTLELPEGGGVSGRVVDETGAPVASARVLFRDAEGFDHPGSLVPFTDDSGAFQAFGLPPGEYTLRAFGPDGRSSERVFLKSPGVDPDLRLALPPPTEENER